MSRRQANRLFAQYRDRANLSSSYGPHSLRHTCGTELLEQGVNLRVVQEILGHAHVTTTELYTQVRRGPKARAMRLLPSTPLVLTQTATQLKPKGAAIHRLSKGRVLDIGGIL